MPLVRRLPKFGFTNINRKEYKAVNIDTLQLLAEAHNLTVISPEVLKEHGLVSRNDRVKILGNGSLTAKLEVKAHGFSATAISAIEAAGGKIEKL
jgi:large subunit ribosomal protein L15